MTLVAGFDVDLTIEKPAAGGRMIARHDGQVILVSNAIPGERVRARIERVVRGVTYAHARDILEPDPDRRGSVDAHACGGAVYAHIAYPRQLRTKADVVADAFARIARMPLAVAVPVAPSPEIGYRMRNRLHVEGRRIGSYREGTHDLCDPAPTGQLLPATIETLDRLAAALPDCAPLVTTIELAENIPGTERAAHFQFSAPPGAAGLAAIQVEGLTGASFDVAGQGGVALAFGSPFLTDVLIFVVGAQRTVDVALRRRATAFFQANRFLLPALVSRVVACVGQDDGEVVDLYAGVGLFALSLAAAGSRKVTAVEGDRTSADDLLWNAEHLASGVRALAMPVERFLADRSPRSGATLIVDPPRTGMTRTAVAGILAERAARIVYVSCDVATLARDAARLVESGYAIERLEAFDLFPNTAHVEALAVFRRA
jgi:tRNA/tmRNA/rRNA uracil-C5-methylase (TrmA/RlmC/RlmD family)